MLVHYIHCNTQTHTLPNTHTLKHRDKQPLQIKDCITSDRGGKINRTQWMNGFLCVYSVCVECVVCDVYVVSMAGFSRFVKKLLTQRVS